MVVPTEPGALDLGRLELVLVAGIVAGWLARMALRRPRSAIEACQSVVLIDALILKLLRFRRALH